MAWARMQQVLVVEDSAVIRVAVVGIVQALGYLAFAAKDGYEALWRLRAHPRIDAIVTDIHMPGMDGLTLIEHVRVEFADRRLPVIVHSSEDDESLRQRADACGVSLWLGKPASAAVLHQALRAALAPRGGPAP